MPACFWETFMCHVSYVMSRCTLRNLYASNIWIIWSWAQGCSTEVSYKLITSYFWQLESKFLKKMNHSKSTWEFWLWINLKCIIEFWLYSTTTTTISPRDKNPTVLQLSMSHELQFNGQWCFPNACLINLFSKNHISSALLCICAYVGIMTHVSTDRNWYTFFLWFISSLNNKSLED